MRSSNPDDYQRLHTNYSPIGYGSQNGHDSSIVTAYVRSDVRELFAVDQGHSGSINREELHAALINFQGKRFTESACKLMLNLFSQNHSGTINIIEFQQLCDFVNHWVNIFYAYNLNRPGGIDERELFQVLQEMGFQISLDQFIIICVQIKKSLLNSDPVIYTKVESFQLPTKIFYVWLYNEELKLSLMYFPNRQKWIGLHESGHKSNV